METCLLDQIPRYESKYFNCVKSQTFSYLKNKGLPLELLLFNSFENTRSVYQQFLVEKKPKWEFLSPCMSKQNLELLNISLNEKWYPSFNEAEFDIRQILMNNEVAIIASDLFYLPHRGHYYNNVHINHFVIVVGVKNQGQSLSHYHLLDDNSSALGDYILYTYDRQLIATAFDCTDKNILFLDYPDIVGPDERNRIKAAYSRWISEYEDDFQYYDRIFDIVKGEGEGFSSREEAIEQVVSSLTVISGSRFVFANYCKYVEKPEKIVTGLQESSKLAEVIKNMLVRSNITKKIDLNALESRLGSLKQMDSETIRSLKIQFIH